MGNNEKLALLYQETPSKENKEKIFKVIYDALIDEAREVCHYYKKCLNRIANQDLFFEDAMQEACICLVKCIENFDISKNTQLSTYYKTCLSNHLSDVFKSSVKIGINEFIDSTAFDWINNGYSNETVVENIDNKVLYDILSKHIDNLPFSKPLHKQIFKDYWQFSDDKSLDKTSFGSLGTRYKLSRMAVKKIVDKYFALLKQSLVRSGDIDRIQEYL